MRALIAPLVLAAACLALPGLALAQSAGDEQYSDPLAGQSPPSGGGGNDSGSGAGQPQGGSSNPSQGAETAQTDTGTGTGTGGDSSGAQGSGRGGSELPRTGLAAGLLAALGALFLLGGQGMRRAGRRERRALRRAREPGRWSGHGPYDPGSWNDLLDALGRRR